MVLAGSDAEFRYLGIDLAAQPKNTAACSLVRDRTGMVRVDDVGTHQTDHGLLEQMTEADWVAIDAPFGWPVDFKAALDSFVAGGVWPSEQVERDAATYDWGNVRLRETDRQVTKLTLSPDIRSCRPLSVSADSIAVVAFRAARLLTGLAERNTKSGGRWRFDRTGSLDQPLRVIEVYPAATLALLGTRKPAEPTYRGNDGQAGQRRTRYLTELARQHAIDLGSFEASLAATDHAFDAFVCSLTAVLVHERKSSRRRGLLTGRDCRSRKRRSTRRVGSTPQTRR